MPACSTLAEEGMQVTATSGASMPRVVLRLDLILSSHGELDEFLLQLQEERRV